MSLQKRVLRFMTTSLQKSVRFSARLQA